MKNARGILVYFGSCVENLIDNDEGKAQFEQEKLALEIYRHIDQEVLDTLGEYTEDFFTNLSDLTELGSKKTSITHPNEFKIHSKL